TIESVKSEYYLGEPVILKFKIRNSSNENIGIPHDSVSLENYSIMSKIDGDNFFMHFVNLYYDMDDNRFEVQADSMFEFTHMLAYSASKYFSLAEAGRYEVYV